MNTGHASPEQVFHESRAIEPKKLGLMIRGDLDWIIMKALEKDRTRRYETANAFAADIDRHLGNEPVLASPPSAVYRLRKFVRRNRRSVIAAGVLLVVLLGGIAGTSVGLFAHVWRFKRQSRPVQGRRVSARSLTLRQSRHGGSPTCPISSPQTRPSN